jgi:hypothetical protein
MNRFVWVEESFIKGCLVAFVSREGGILLLLLLIYPRLPRESYFPSDTLGEASAIHR